MSVAPLTSIALFGRPAELWPVAALLARNLPESMRIIAVEEAGRSGAAPVSMKAASKFHDALGIDAQQLIDGCDGRYGLGTDLADWQGEGSRYFVAATGSLPRINGIALNDIMLRAAQMNNEPEKLAYLFHPFRFAARIAMEGKFALASADPQSPLIMLGPMLQLDAAGYGAFLKATIAEGRVETVSGNPVQCARSGDDGAIESVTLDEGAEIAADLFIDVSGALSALDTDPSFPSGAELRAYLPFDRQMVGRGAGDGSVHMSAQAAAGGFIVKTPLASELVSQFFYASDTVSEADAQAICGDDAVAAPFAAGYRDTPWEGNLARLGPASASLSPLFSADTMLLNEQAMQLVRCIPARRTMRIEASEFNRKHLGLVRQLRDFLILPFLTNRRTQDLWVEMWAAEVPETLRVRLDQFRSRGRLATFDFELIDPQTWIETMIGLGIVPERYDPMADAIDMKRIVPVLRNLVDGFNRTIADLPDA